MNRYKSILFAGMLLPSRRTATAQGVAEEKKQHELSVYGKGALHSLNYRLTGDAKQNSRYGAGLVVRYARYLTSNWSVSAGLEYQLYRSEAVLYGFNGSYAAVDAEGDAFEFRSSAGTYREWQWVNMVNIPLQVQYEALFYGSAGFQMGIPFLSKYKATASGLNTSAYYQQWDATLEAPRFMGFGSWGTVQSGKQELGLRNSYSVLLEVGLKQRVTEKRALYIGLYAELGLNNLAKKDIPASGLIGYDTDNPEGFRFSPVFYAAPTSGGEAYASGVKARALGLKLRYAFNW